MKRQRMIRTISHQDVQNAIKKYLEQGGFIQKLPRQKSQEAIIGLEKYGEFELVSELPLI